MEPPKSYKKVQKPTGCLAALNRFISNSGERNLASFKTLRRMSQKKFTWDEENVAVSSMLIKEEEGTQRPIYYVSHVLRGAEERYNVIDKASFSLVISVRKLKAYFESHLIQVVTDQPLKRVLTIPALSGRLTTWAVELSEFELSYIPRINVKAQALVDFVIESTTRASPQALMRQIEEVADPKEFEWSLHVYGARNDKGAGPHGVTMEVKNKVLKRYHCKVVSLAQGFARIEFRHIPREETEEADRLSRLATTYYSELSEEVPIPFATWEVDLVGKLPKEKGGVEFAIVAVDYFRKWVEAVPLKKTRGEEVTHFLWKNILTRFGIPKILVSANGTQFEGQVVANFSEKFGIEHRFDPFYYLQSNGQVEVMNCIIFKGIKKNIFQSRKSGGSWVEELPTVLWSLRSISNQATGEAPFSLIYETETILAAEVGLPTYRQAGFHEERNDQRLLEALNFTDELRDQALYKILKYKQLLARIYNRRVKNRQFRIGDLVLRLFSTIHPKEQRKLSPKLEGPYRIKQILGPGTDELEDLDGKPIVRTWHTSKLCKYYM
ncbi:hypothetical protein LIER_28192 [Lithospermum erythrorhizon]|uniref:Integrase catalytic domain-containing protein n=1 Tax=Lithospermum erythrorhizon TaxID=34254 RepID=A0AAV3REV4_LITER